MNDPISVIVATYNREDALGAVLRALSQQTDRRFEVVVADDGSRADTAAVVGAWAARVGVAVKHAWQEDCGFRAAESRNRAIRASTGAYCVFLDGDCIPRHDFIAAHRALAEPGYFVSGNRVLLSPALTERILIGGLEPEGWTLGQFLTHRRRGEINRMLPLLRLPLGALRKQGGRRWQGARSCNAGCFRADLDRVDGFDAAYAGWGREDSDLFVRLIRSGIKRKNGHFATGVLHLWHPEGERSQLVHNEAKLDLTLRSDRWRAVQGLSTLDILPTKP